MRRDLLTAAWLAAVLAGVPAWADGASTALPRALTQPAVRTPKALGAAMLAVTRAGQRLVAAGERGTVLLSDDGGRRWRQAAVPVQVSLTAVRFADEKSGWAVGHMGTILRSEDGGETWTLQLDGVRAAQLLAAAARGDERLQRAAQRFVDEGPDKPFFDVEASSAQRAIVVGAYNLAFETSDGGATWTPLSWRLPNAKHLHLYGVRFSRGALFIAGEQGLLLKSADGGATFAPMASPYKGSFFGLLAAKSGTLLAYGLRGNAYRSADGGATWQQAATGVPVSLSGAVELDDGALVVTAQTGQLLASRDDARSFAALPIAAPPVPTAALAAAPGGLVLASLRGMRAAPAP